MCYENSKDQLIYAYIYALILKKKNPNPTLFLYISKIIKHHSRKRYGLFFLGIFSLCIPSSEEEEKHIIILLIA